MTTKSLRKKGHEFPSIRISSQLINLQRCCSQLTQRVVILENILIQQFGRQVVAAGESVIKMLDFNLKQLNSHLIRPRARHLHHQIKTKKYVKDENWSTRVPLMGKTQIEDLIKVEHSDDYASSENEKKVDADYNPDMAETFMTSDSELDGGSFHDKIPDEDDNDNYETHHTASRDDRTTQRRQTRRRSVASEHLLKLKSRLMDSDGSAATSTPSKPFKCNKCGKFLQRAYNLRLHLLLHRSDEKYKCEFCTKGFRTEFLRNLHVRSHTEERPFKCSECELAFSSTWKLRLHSRFHNPENPFACNVCEKKYKTKSALSRHESTHQQFKPYLCPKCEQRFYTSSHTRRHLRNIHKCFENLTIEKDPELLKIEKAKKVPRKPRIVTKIKVRRERRLEREICHLCGASVVELRQHLKIHETPYNCNFCGKVFKSKFAMNFHQMQVHIDGTRPFRCNLPGCDARFTHSSTLRHHRLSHSTTRRYKCQICNKAYKHSSGLRVHKLTIHSDAPPQYNCPQCPTHKSFYSSSHLSRHLRTVHASHRTVVTKDPPAVLNDQQPKEEAQETPHLIYKQDSQI